LGFGVQQIELLLIKRVHLLKLDQFLLHLQQLLYLLSDAGDINNSDLAKLGTALASSKIAIVMILFITCLLLL
jgi:hypothetical protein